MNTLNATGAGAPVAATDTSRNWITNTYGWSYVFYFMGVGSR